MQTSDATKRIPHWQSDSFGELIGLGGVQQDIIEGGAEKIREVLATVHNEMDDFYHVVTIPSLSDRTQTTGIISPEVARDLNLVGPVTRASGIDRDVRRDHPYAAYSDLDSSVITEQTGDVQGRFMVKFGEIYESIRLVEQALVNMPSGPLFVECPTVPSGQIGLSLVETPRGEAMHWIYAGEGKPYRHKIRDPSYYNWLPCKLRCLGTLSQTSR